MAIGDIDIQSFTIGSMNILDPATVALVGFNIYEDILNPYGPMGEARLYDYNDTLGKNSVNGKEDVTIKFGIPTGKQTLTYNFKLFQNKNLSDQSTEEKGSMHSKRYDYHFISPEMLNAQGNYVGHSFNTLTSDMVKQILENNFKTTHSIQVDSPTVGQRRLVFHNEHPLRVIQKLNLEHVSSKNKSSCYTVYKTQSSGNQVYKITEFEELFKQSPVVTLNQTAGLAVSSSDQDKQNSIMWFNGGDSFQTSTRAFSKSNPIIYNPSIGEIHNRPPAAPIKYYVAGQPVYATPRKEDTAVPTVQNGDSVNNKIKTGTADAKANRLDFLSHLSQNSMELEVPGNPLITLGSMVNLNIPKKANQDNGSGETQLNGPALVVSIRHKVKPLGQVPRYTMILRVVKAGFNQGGGGNG